MSASEVSTECSTRSDTPKSIGQILKEQLFYLKISMWMFGTSVVSGATANIVWPYQIVSCFGTTDMEYLNGVIPIAGVFLNVLMLVITGYMSDHTKTRFGKRRPYILPGTIIMIVFLAAMSRLDGTNSSVAGFILLEVGFYFGQGIAAGAYSGIIPDVCRMDQAGIASGWLGVMWACGTLTGALVAGSLVPGGDTNTTTYTNVYGFMIAMLGFSAIIALVFMWEDKCDETSFDGTIKGFAWSFYLPSATYYNFYWVIITRFMNTMGCYMVIGFLYYFTWTVVGYQKLIASSVILATIIAFSVPSSIIGGYISDRYSITKYMVYVASIIQALAIALLIVISYHPSYAGMLVILAFFGVGYGCYQCVDWALALRVLPYNSIGKDMGIWHISFNGPMIVAPFITSNILKYMIPKYGLSNSYATVFGFATFWFILALFFIIPLDEKMNQPKKMDIEMAKSSNSSEEVTNIDASVSVTRQV
ncbi:hypothetical protein SAMD00019534_017990 [Acytostelium subglobosum LB1]|uniref:hypothetical protein n=1 Tax=Acytostelium subglobosum LB1 TaxID=1410327 RepID=UPI000644E8D8|nr:hypothetical protein SAMD00019534_017990 [Acytostelium subglobosum LB1]GAM18624.1 hypothetical protein SAMD00019534_017990 [Acytostelium subglobosum LB1]|eukprot:XP_012757844.1 hypothetical protein SAMD00019534_017990 [Acytostelium subglobosum LB1]